MRNTPKTNKIVVRIDHITALKLAKLGYYMGETPLDVIAKLVNHAYNCDLWQLQRDMEIKYD